MKAKKVTAIILAGAICAAAFTGCGINTGATAASMKNQTVTMGMANFTCRYQQGFIWKRNNHGRHHERFRYGTAS